MESLLIVQLILTVKNNPIIGKHNDEGAAGEEQNVIFGLCGENRIHALKHGCGMLWDSFSSSGKH